MRPSEYFIRELVDTFKDSFSTNYILVSKRYITAQEKIGALKLLEEVDTWLEAQYEKERTNR